MRVHDLAHDGEPEPRSLRRLVLRVACAEVAVEEVRDFVRRDALAQ